MEVTSPEILLVTSKSFVIVYTRVRCVFGAMTKIIETNILYFREGDMKPELSNSCLCSQLQDKLFQ